MSGSYPAEVLGCGSEGSGTEVSVSVTHPVEVLGCGSEESVAEVSVSVPHPAEVLECPAEESGADWTISFFSEFEIVLAAALTIAPVQRIGFLNVLMPVVSHFARHSRSIFFLGSIFFSSLWTSLVPSGRTVTSGLAWALVPRLPRVTFLAWPAVEVLRASLFA